MYTVRPLASTTTVPSPETLAVLNVVLGDELDGALVAVLLLLDELHPAATSTPAARNAGTHRRNRGWHRGLRDIRGLIVMP
jgi:hypothetical protein